MDQFLKEPFECLRDEFGLGRGSDLQEVQGINPPFISALFEVINELWSSSPWKRLRSRDLLGVKVGTKSDWKPLSCHPFKCIRFSVTSRNYLVVDALRKVKDALGPNRKPTKAIPESGLLRITFGPKKDLFPKARRMLLTLGLDIPSPNAYPSVEIISSSKFGEVGSFISYRDPNLAELKWLVAALKAVTAFHPALKLQVKNKILVPRDSFEEVTVSGELSVPTTARDYLQEEESAVVVRVSYPPKSSIADMPNLQEGNDGGPPPKLYSASRQCVKCMKALPPTRAARCGGCKAVFYCGTLCQKKDWKNIHRDECRKYKEMMDRAAKLVIKELSFPVMDFEEPCGWLEETEVHQKGMWRRLCKCYQSCPFGHLPTGSMAGGSVHAAAWGLENGKFPPDRPLEIDFARNNRSHGSNKGAKGNKNHSGSTSGQIVIRDPTVNRSNSKKSNPSEISVKWSRAPGEETDSQGTTGSSARTTGSQAFTVRNTSRSSESDGPSSSCTWLYYYNIRSLPFSSPVAAILSYPMTVYYAVTQLCKSTKKILARNKEAIIHYLNPKSELDWVPAFAEIGHLLDAFHGGSLHIVMVGPQVPDSLSGEATTLGKKLKMTYVQGLYQDEASALFAPHLVVALDAGLDRSETWAGDLRIIKDLAVPTYFTDYTETCCLNSQQVLLAAELQPTVPYTDLPWYINGFIFGVNV
ncbi:hypothetical protein R1sor_020786 [Riccia sorocarpa]|uniref:MYND-type domain-containing protein n=1 Tax=Riccia sorocarpa TaxID=122646 RepID=A0ABD3GII8_9MARC